MISDGFFEAVSFSISAFVSPIFFSVQDSQSPVRSVDQSVRGSRSPMNAPHDLHHKAIERSFLLGELGKRNTINSGRAICNRGIPEIGVEVDQTTKFFHEKNPAWAAGPKGWTQWLPSKGIIRGIPSSNAFSFRLLWISRNALRGAGICRTFY